MWAEQTWPDPDEVAGFSDALWTDQPRPEDQAALDAAADAVIANRIAWAILAATVETDAPNLRRPGTAAWWAWWELLVEHGYQPSEWEQSANTARRPDISARAFHNSVFEQSGSRFA